MLNPPVANTSHWVVLALIWPSDFLPTLFRSQGGAIAELASRNSTT